MLFKVVVMVAGLLFAGSAQAYEGKPLPPHLQRCADQAIEDIILLAKESEEAKYKFFLRNIDKDQLGYRAYRGLWSRTEKLWREMAIRYAYSYIKGESDKLTEGMKDVKNTVITLRLADNPIINKRGKWHIAGTVTLDNGNSFSVSMLVTDSCKAFDFARGSAWITWALRNQIGVVDRLVSLHKKKQRNR